MADAEKKADEMVNQISVDRATRRSELAEVNYQGGNLFLPTNGKMLMDMANMMSQSGDMVPKLYRSNSGACMALIAVCAGHGLNPIMTAWHTYKVSDDAPISYEAKVIVAMINASGVLAEPFDYVFEGTGPDRQCTVNGKLKDGTIRSYTSPRIADIRPKKGTHWANDPDQALCYWSGRAWVRRHKPEMMLGVYSPEELEPAVGPDRAKDITPQDAPVPARGGVRYREVDDPVPNEEVDKRAADDAEVVDETELAVRSEAAKAADRGTNAFVGWWQQQTKEVRARFSDSDLAGLKEVCAAADAAAEEAAAHADAAVGAESETAAD